MIANYHWHPLSINRIVLQLNDPALEAILWEFLHEANEFLIFRALVPHLW